MTCWVCKRSACGYGHAYLKRTLRYAEQYPRDWVFCSRRCQDAFHKLYERWMRVLTGRESAREIVMIDASEIERTAMRACLKNFGSAAGKIGFEKPLGAYSEHEALQVIDAIVTGYTEAMVVHHEATKFPPVRSRVSSDDPMSASLGEFQDDPLPASFVGGA